MKRDTDMPRNKMRSVINEESFFLSKSVHSVRGCGRTSGIIKDLSPESPTRLANRRGEDDGARFESRQESRRRKEKESATTQKMKSYTYLRNRI